MNTIASEFPIMQKTMQGKRLVYLDNAATTQKPKLVLDAMQSYYETTNANVHRGIYQLSANATIAYEKAHEKTAKFIGANGMEEIVFTKNATESFNLLARMLEPMVNEGDEMVVSQIEHHSNLIPWQKLAERKRAKLKFIPVNTQTGLLDVSNIQNTITEKTKIVAVTHASNVLGTKIDLQPIISRAHEVNAKTVIDGAQAVGHFPVNVKELGADFYAFSGHKMYGPTGIGVFYGKKQLLEELEPAAFGGDMVREVSFETATWNNLPWKFEPGTPPIAEGIGLSAAIDFLQQQNMQTVEQHERELSTYLFEKLSQIPDVTIYGPPTQNRIGVFSFNVGNVHPHDLASLLDQDGVCVRAGHHCAMPLMQLLNVPATIRASLGIYNTKEDVDSLIDGIQKAQKIFKPKQTT